MPPLKCKHRHNLLSRQDPLADTYPLTALLCWCIPNDTHRPSRPHRLAHRSQQFGKTTLAQELHRLLTSDGHRVEILDGDEIRGSLSDDLGFSKQDRDEQVRRIGFVAQLLTRNGIITIVSAISPYGAARNAVATASHNSSRSTSRTTQHL